jgi:hypothetical protein
VLLNNNNKNKKKTDLESVMNLLKENIRETKLIHGDEFMWMKLEWYKNARYGQLTRGY